MIAPGHIGVPVALKAIKARRALAVVIAIAFAAAEQSPASTQMTTTTVECIVAHRQLIELAFVAGVIVRLGLGNLKRRSRPHRGGQEEGDPTRLLACRGCRGAR